MKTKLCAMCKKREVRYLSRSANYGFCSKICIANNAIAHYKMKDLKKTARETNENFW